MTAPIGLSVKRREDRRLLTGRGRYVDDVRLSHLCHAAIVRSPHAHARIVDVDARRATVLPGVVAVLTIARLAGVRGGGPAPRGLAEVPPLRPARHRWAEGPPRRRRRGRSIRGAAGGRQPLGGAAKRSATPGIPVVVASTHRRPWRV